MNSLYNSGLSPRLKAKGNLPLFLLLGLISIPLPGRGSATEAETYLDAGPFTNLAQAVAQAIEMKKPGVVIPAGRSIAAEGPISLPDGFAIAGADPLTSKIVLKPTQTMGFVLKGTRNNLLRNLILDGSDIAPSSPGAGPAMTLEQVENVAIQKVTFLSVPQMAIVGSGRHVRIEVCRFLGGRGSRSIQISEGADWQLLHNEIRGGGAVIIGPSTDPYDKTPGLGQAGGGKDGLWIFNGERLLILGNTFDDTGQAIHLNGDGMRHSLVAHNLIPRGVRGHAVWQCIGPNDGNVYAYNEFHGVGKGPDGKEVDGAASAFQTWSGGNNLVVGNLFKDIAGYAINDSSNYQPLGNMFSDNVLYNIGDPVVLVNSSEGSTIRRNRIGPSGSLGVNLGIEVVMPYGATIRYGAHNCWLVNNVIRGNAIPGVMVGMLLDGLIQGNRILDNGANLAVWPPEWRSPEGTSGIKLLWGPQFVGYNETANTRIIGNRIGNTQTDASKQTQRYGIWAGTVNRPGQPINMGWAFANQPIDPNDTLTFRNNTIRWNDMRRNRDEAIHLVPGANPAQHIDHNAIDDQSLVELRDGPALADAGPSLVVAGGSLVHLTADATRCPEGVDPSQLRYSWSQETEWTQRRGPSIGIGAPDTPRPVISFPKVDKPTIYGFKLKVTRTISKEPAREESTEDKVYVAVFNDQQAGPKLPATFDRDEPFSADGPSGYHLVKLTPTNGWNWGITGGSLEARLQAGSGAVNLIPDGKVFGQVASIDLVSAKKGAAKMLPLGACAGLVLVNRSADDRPVDGYFIGLHRGLVESKPSLKVIRLRGCTAPALSQLDAKATKLLCDQPWEGERLHLGIQRLGDRFSFDVNGKLAVAEALTLLDEPYFDGPLPTLIGMLVAASEGESGFIARFDNLSIDHRP